MKKLLFYFMAAAALGFTACSDDDNNGPVIVEGNQIPSEITEEISLNPSVAYTLSSTVNVKAGGKLIIPAGTTIRSNAGFAAYILVEQGGKIEATGTATQPIKFTSSNASPKAGDWGGLIINGYAPISGATAGTTGTTEVDNSKPYGGTNVADNSGILEYVIIEYSGARSSADVEHNGLTLNGVGNGTKIENIFVKEGSDDGIEFFGGSVNVTNLFVLNSDDDMFDFTQGYTGTLKNCYGIWETNYSSTEADPRGIEADGNLDGNGATHVGQSNFKVENMTIDIRSTVDGVHMHDVIKVRRGAKATITNAVVTGVGIAKDLVDGTDSKGNCAAGTTISIANNLTNNLTGAQNNGEAATVTINHNNTGCDASLFAWTGYNFSGSGINYYPGNNLKGEITQEVHLSAAVEYVLESTLLVKNGGKLVIPAGTVIRSEGGFASYLLVEQGGKIEAIGTASNPVVFTSSKATPAAGDWGGLIINGKAPLSGATAGTTGTTEVDNSKPYGGTDVADNSGILEYVIIEYSGARSSADVEHNGLTLNGVGNGTKIENIFVKEGSDDGIEFFGGSVDVTNLLVVNPDDDMFDFTQGYTGTLKNCYGIWLANYSSTEADPRGIEADGNLDGNGSTHVGQSDFKVENMTIDIRSTGVEVFMHDAVKIRRGAKATITNALVKGVGIAKDLVDGTDTKGTCAAGTTISITNSLANPLTGKFHNGDVAAVTESTTNTGSSKELFSWTKFEI